MECRPVSTSKLILLSAILFLGSVACLRAQNAFTVQVDSTGSIISPTNFTASNVDGAMVFGQEYLSRFHSRVMSGVTPRVVFSGDSTTQGGGAIEDITHNGLSQAFETICLSSLGSMECLNAGHSGAMVYHWLTNYLAADLALAPDLYVLRWGLNPNAVGSFEVDLRAGLKILRDAFPVDRMSVVLMTPNAANDSPNHRDRAYLDSINPVIRRAARDFQCVFIDLARVFPDATADPVMMDDAYGDGRRVHPRDVFNQSIASLIADVVLPKGMAGFGTARFQNLNASESWHDSGATPASFHAGITLERAFARLGWPLEGAVATERQADGVVRQANYASGQSGIRVRTGSGTEWSLWGDGIVVNPRPEDATLSATNSPGSLPTGVSVWVAPADRGWPTSGQVTAIRQAGGSCLQIHSDASGGIALRTGASEDRWTRWSAVSAGGAGLGTPVGEVGAAAGAGASVELKGTDSNGTIQLTTGASTGAAGTVLKLYWGTVWPSDPHPVLSPANGAAAALAGGQLVFVGEATRTNLVLEIGSVALAPNTTYRWNWMVGLGATVSEPLRAAALVLGAQVAGDGGFDLVVSGTPGRACLIEASADVERWERVAEVPLTSATQVYRASAQALEGRRFFRARVR